MAIAVQYSTQTGIGFVTAVQDSPLCNKEAS